MQAFIASPHFTLWAFAISIVVVALAVLRANTKWFARGITPQSMVTVLKKGSSLLSWANPSRLLGFISWKLIAIAIVLWEGIFGFFAMSNVPRPDFLNWIPHWGTPTLSTAGLWVLTYWLPVLILWGSVMGTIHLLTKGTLWEKDGGVLRLVATIVVGAAFVLAAGSWFFGGPSSTRLASVEPLSPDATHVYVLNTNWTEIADGASGNYARCIHVPDSELPHYQQKVLGSNLTAYRSTQGSFAIRGRLEPGPHCTFDP